MFQRNFISFGSEMPQRDKERDNKKSLSKAGPD